MRQPFLETLLELVHKMGLGQEGRVGHFADFGLGGDYVEKFIR
ncbi:hypothetical protein ACMAY7_14625 [Rhodobacteraceae bacterium nBUS_24]